MGSGSYSYEVISSVFNEDAFEQGVVDHLCSEHGYEYLYGPDVPRSSDAFDVASDEVGDEEEREFEVDGVRLAAEPRVKREELRCREDDEEDDERDDDAVAPLDLLFVHG